MKYPVHKPANVKSKVVILSGGLKEDVSQLEMKPGQLINGFNYQEIDGVYHGYSSIPGYERFDGQTKPSEVDAVGLTDYGDDSNTSLLLESNTPTTTADLSKYAHTITADETIADTANKEFQASSFYFNLTSIQVTPVDTSLDLSLNPALDPTDFQIEARVRPASALANMELVVRDTSYKLELSGGKLKFSYSTDGVSYTDTVTFDTIILPNVWTHISVIRKEGNIYASVGGVKETTSYTCGVDEIFAESSDVYIGNDSFIGQMDEIRICTTYRWIYDFAVPVLPYSTAGYYAQQWDDEAREAQRLLITDLDGAGPVRAINIRNGVVAAIRDNLLGTAADLWFATGAGWVQSGLGLKIMQYENGIDTDGAYPGFLSGETVTGSISGATGVIKYVTQTSGSWENIGTARDATGYIVVESVVGGPFVDTDVLSNGVTATADVLNGSYTTFELQPEGEYEIINARFDELPDHQRELLPFMVNGVNFPIYYDDTNIVPIAHSNLPDEDGVFATHVIEFKGRLFLAYPDGRIWYSAIANPLNYDVIDGAGVMYMEDTITGMHVSPGGTLIVFCRNRIQVIKSIYDSTSDPGTTANYSFSQETFSQRSGAIPGTHERLLGNIFFMDDRGLTSMETTDTYGDFSLSSASKSVQNSLLSKKNDIVGVIVNREANQLRMHFTDKKAYVFTFNVEKKVKGVTELKYLHTPSFLTEGEDADGNHIMFMGCTDGYVYQLDTGTSFDGEEIDTKLETTFHHYGSPTNWKRFQKITLEAQADKGLIFRGNPSYNYRDSNIPRSTEETYVASGAGGKWGLDAYGEFKYGGAVIQSPVLYLTGYGNNMSMTIITSDKYSAPHVLNSMIVEYSTHSRKM